MNEVAVVQRRDYKNRWQREQRRRFAAERGYSTAANYSTGGLRQAVLERDAYRCVRCGMPDGEHRATWGRPITVDHKDKDRANNSLENLQTLCLRCHGNKDLIPRLRQQRVPAHREEIMRRRAAGETYQAISDGLGFSVATVWKWIQIWEKEAA